MKRFLTALILFISCICPVFSDSYQITEISYDMSGLTREYALSQKVPVDTHTVFSDYDTFAGYINNLKQQLNNQRVFEFTDVSFFIMESETDNIHPVHIIITTTDSINILGVPYPSYDSNTGISFKLKLKDYNFLGSMETMNFDLNYQAKGTDSLDDVTHIYGLNFDFSVPFNLIVLPSSWNSDFSFSYTVGNPEIDMKIKEGISTSIPINNILSADISFNQYYIQNSEYFSAHDDKYFRESVEVSLPVTLYSIKNWSDLTWKPLFRFSYNWDTDSFSGLPHGGIVSDDLTGPELFFSHSISLDHVDWFGNFRDGITCSLNNSYSHNLFNNSNSISLIFLTQYYKKLCSHVGLSSRLYCYKNFNDTISFFGSMLRGIRDNDWSSTNYLLFNFDLPVSLFHINWNSIFGWDKLNFFNFEFQLSPFFDFAFGENSWSQSTYNFRDGWYSTGFECLVFPDKFRSIQGRISFGIDAVQFLQKYDKDHAKTNGISKKLFNTNWRTENSSWFELSIGIGLFY